MADRVRGLRSVRLPARWRSVLLQRQRRNRTITMRPAIIPAPRAYYYGGGSSNCDAYYNTVCGGPYNYYAPNSGYYYGN